MYVFVSGDSRVEMRRVEVLLTPKQVHAVVVLLIASSDLPALPL